jgi:phytoene synthase
MDAAAHVRQLVRSADGDRYLSVLYAPEDQRRSLLALYAFNVEVASIRDRIREPLAGEMRLTWWRDAVASGITGVTGNPVADELNAAIERHRLPHRVFADMLEARMFDLYDDPMPDRGTLEGYCGETAGALIQLAALVLDAEAAQGSGEAAGHGGCAQAITGLLRLLPIHRARGQCYVPADILRAAGTSRDELVSSEPGEGASRALAAMIALAREHLARFEGAAKELPKSLRPAFLPVALSGLYLRAVEVVGPKALTIIADIGSFNRHWTLLRHASRGWR